MERNIKTWRDPYVRGFDTTKKKEITLKSGLTVLVGCNGAGKSTLLKNIRDELNNQSIPNFLYDDNYEGHHMNTFGPAIERQDITYLATAMQSSEGENISINLNMLAARIHDFLETGEDVEQRRQRALDEKYNNIVYGPVESKERWILLDAIDSGYSIDNVIHLKNFFNALIEYGLNKDLDVFIVCSANEFELAYQTSCFDVMKGEYCKFETYDDFKTFILKTADLKEKREEKAEAKHKEKQED